MLRLLGAILFISLPVVVIYLVSAVGGSDQESDRATNAISADRETEEAAEKERAVNKAVGRLRKMSDVELKAYVSPCVDEFYRQLREDRAIVNYDMLGRSPDAQIEEQIEDLRLQAASAYDATLSVDLFAYEVRDGFSTTQVIGDYRCYVSHIGKALIRREGELDLTDF